jgi:hypothetical protein
MISKLTDEKLKYYNNLINTNNNKIEELKKKINTLKLDNYNIKNIIINNCNHDIVIDYTAYNERTEYICKNCSM